MSEISNEIVATSTLNNDLNSMAAGQAAGFYSSITGTDFDSKLEVLNAMTDSQKIDDVLGQTIMVRNIIIQAIEMTDEETGEIKPQPRVVIIDEDGAAYAGISAPLYRDVKNWMNVLGQPSEWEGALPVKVTKEGTGNRRYFKASIVRSPKKK